MVSLVKQSNDVLIFFDDTLATILKNTNIDEAVDWLRTVVKFESLKVMIRD
jgi:hypothetical protein